MTRVIGEGQTGGGSSRSSRQQPQAIRSEGQAGISSPGGGAGGGKLGESQGHLIKGDAPKTETEKAAYLGVSSTTQAEQMWQAAIAYSDGSYGEIRAWQSGVFNEDGHTQGYLGELRMAARNVEEYVAHAPKWGYAGETYRGIDLSPSDYAKITTIGAKIDNRGACSSWSSSKSVAKMFAGTGYYSDRKSVVLVSQSQKFGTSIRHLSHYTEEDEVLVSSKAQHYVSAVKEEGGITYVYVVEQ